MAPKDIAEHIAGDSACATGEFHVRVNAILPYLLAFQHQVRLQTEDDMLKLGRWLRVDDGEGIAGTKETK